MQSTRCMDMNLPVSRDWPVLVFPQDSWKTSVSCFQSQRLVKRNQSKREFFWVTQMKTTLISVLPCHWCYLKTAAQMVDCSKLIGWAKKGSRLDSVLYTYFIADLGTRETTSANQRCRSGMLQGCAVCCTRKGRVHITHIEKCSNFLNCKTK